LTTGFSKTSIVKEVEILSKDAERTAFPGETALTLLKASISILLESVLS